MLSLPLLPDLLLSKKNSPAAVTTQLTSSPARVSRAALSVFISSAAEVLACSTSLRPSRKEGGRGSLNRAGASGAGRSRRCEAGETGAFAAYAQLVSLRLGEWGEQSDAEPGRVVKRVSISHLLL